MSDSRFRVVAAAFLLALLTTAAWAQQVTGSLTAIVQDKSGAVIPNAQITLTNANSGDVRKAATNAEGYFSITGIFPGTYSVTVEAPGFSTYKLERIGFNPGDARTLPNIAMEVGTVGTEIRVTDVLETLTPVDSGEKATVITTQQLQNVAVVSRSAAEFIKIVPGFTPVAGGPDNRPGWNGENMGINGNGDGGKQSAIGNYSANGTPTAALDITMDGAHTADPGCNCATPVNPNPDMISEIKIQTSNFAAENYKGPVVISAVTKSGGRDFHGTGYLFARHHSMYSNDWYNNKIGIKKPENQYFFPGGNFSGPVLIPGTGFNKNRDKLFFFAGYEYFKQTIDSGLVQAIVPTAAMRRGDFSDTNYLSVLNRNFSAAGADIVNNFPNRQVSVDPGMQRLLSLVPEPNIDPATSGGYNWAQVLNIPQNMGQFATKVDYNISDYTKLFVRYNRQREVQPFPIQLWWRNAGAVPLPTPVEGRNASDSISANFTKVLNPTLTNEFVFGYTFVDFPNSYQDYDKMTKTANNYPYQGIFNQDDKIPGFLSWAGPISGMWLPGGFDPVLFATKHLFTINDTVSKIVGTHTMKFGGYFGSITNAQPGNEPSAGLIQFSPWHALTTGNVLADMVSGVIDSYTENSMQINRNMGWKELAFFAQDSWKVRRNFTLEFGIRGQHMQPWTARNGIGIATWVPSLYSPTAPATSFPGLGWNAQNPDVPLSGWDTRAMWWAPRFGMAWDIFGNGATVMRGGWGRFVYHDAQLAAGAMDMPAGVRRTTVAGGLRLSEVAGRGGGGDLVFGGETVDSTDNKHPLTDSYSFTISQRLPGRILGEVAYVGNQSKNLINGGAIANINNVPLGAMLNNPQADANLFRPLRQWQDLRVFSHNLYSNYNSLQALLAKQSGRTNFTVAYTWGKALGITNNDLNPFDLHQNYGPLGFDRRHNLSVSYVLTMPNIVSKDTNVIARGLVNGWQISGIVQAYSGVNLQMNSRDANFGLQTPNPIGTGGLSSAWVTGTPATRLMPRLTCDPSQNLQEGQFINGACFAPPIPGENGQPGVNGSYVMPQMTGPAFWNADLSLFKEFSISESKRIQFRAQAYNFLNHPLDSFIGTSDANLTLNFDAAGRLTNPRFGYTDNKVGRRSMMLGIKFYF